MTFWREETACVKGSNWGKKTTEANLLNQNGVRGNVRQKMKSEILPDLTGWAET